MAARLGRHSHRETADGIGQLDQLVGVVQLARSLPGPGGRVPSQRHQVLHTGRPVGDEDLRQLQPGVGHADKVGHGHQGGGAEHPGDQVEGALARLGPSPIGHGHEGRPERFEVAQRLDQRGLLCVVLRREEFERVGPALGQEVGNPSHNRISLLPGVVPDGPAFRPVRSIGATAQPADGAPWPELMRVESLASAVFNSVVRARRASSACASCNPVGAVGPLRSSRSASTANANPRRAPAAAVAAPAACGSGADPAAFSRATAALSTWAAAAPRTSGSSDAAVPETSDSRASWASLRAGITACRHSVSMARFFRDRNSRATTTMAITSTAMRPISPHGVPDGGTNGAVVVVVVLGAAVVVVGCEEVVEAGVVVVVDVGDGTAVPVEGGTEVLVVAASVVVVTATRVAGAPGAVAPRRPWWL